MEAVLFNARICALLVTGKVKAAALKTCLEAETLLHVYNTTWQRLDGTVAMQLLQSCNSQEEAAEYVRAQALACTPIPPGAGPIHIHTVCKAKAAAVPLSCAATGQLGAVATLDIMAAVAQRRKNSREETVLRGLPPGPSLHSCCQHYVDRMCIGDVERLRSNLQLLDGLCLRTASTCSGVDSCIPVVKHTLAALNERFNVSITTKHVLSCELDSTRQDFIRDAHAEEAGLLVADCEEFSNKALTCILRQAKVEVPQADLLISGPSCTQLSQQRRDAKDFVGLLEPGNENSQCESSVTYKKGVLMAAKRMDVVAGIYENVSTVLQSRSDKAGQLHAPPVQQIEKDLADLGFTWQCRRLDTQNFLLPQRRNRAWGLYTRLCEADASADYGNRCEEFFADLSSHVHIQEGLWLESLPKQSLNAKSEARMKPLLEKLKLERSDWADLFIGVGTSSGREQEHACGATTCLRPTQQVYSNRLGRNLTAAEHLRLQGIFANDFARPDVVDALARKQTLAKSFAGKAYSTTVLQANFLCLLTHSDCWKVMRQRGVQRVPPTPSAHVSAEELDTPPPPQRRQQWISPARAQGAREAAATSSASKPTSSQAAQSSSSSKAAQSSTSSARHTNSSSQTARGRKRQRSTRSCRVRKLKPRKAGKQRGHNKKGQVLPLARKVKALEAFRQLQADPSCKHPQKAMLARKAEFPGIYAGCFSKWTKLAASENWQQLAESNEKLASKSKQVPQWLLRTMGLGKPGSGRPAGKLPTALLGVVEDILLRQLEMGSEVTVPAVVKLIESSIEVWNTEVEQLQAEQAKLQGANPPDIAKVHVAASPNAIRKQAEHFLRKYDFQVARVSKPGKHLSTNDPQIIAVKEYVLEQVRKGTVHPAMIGNFDQVWTTLYEPAQRVVWKNPRHRGHTKDLQLDNGRCYRRRALAHKLRVALGLEQESVQDHRVPQAKEDDVYSCANSVSNWRIPRTTTTLSWRNGDVGRLFVTIASDKVSDAELEEAKSLRGLCCRPAGNRAHPHVERPNNGAVSRFSEGGAAHEAPKAGAQQQGQGLGYL